MKKTLFFSFFIFLTIQKIHSQKIDATLIELNYLSDSNPKNLTKGDTKIYFTADDEIHGRELWVYDDISKKTSLVKDIFPGNIDGLEYPNFLVINDILYFTAKDETRKIGLWTSNGTEAGTHLIKYLNEYNTYYSYKLLNYNGKVVFLSKEEDDQSQSFWITDGTSEGTSLIKNFSNTYSKTIANIKVFKNNIIFSASDNIHGQEIWISDGTPNGTKILKDVNTGINSSNPSDFFILNDDLFFSAYTAENGNELWKTDGTENGTFLLKDIDPSPYRSGIQSGNTFFAYNNSVYFYAKSNINSIELWKSNGTISGTEMVKVIATGSNINNKLYGGVLNSGLVISNFNYLTGTEIWKSDGTSNGTTLIKTIPLDQNDLGDNANFVSFKNKLYFVGGGSTEGKELWVTDGTTDGTKLVQDIYPGEFGSGIIKLTPTSKYLFFAANDDKKKYRTLWLSDGISNGKLINEDINLSQFTNTELSFVELNNNVFFQGGYNSNNGIELWKTDLSTDLTKIEKDINYTQSAVYYPGDFTNFNGKIIFTGTNGRSGLEPFITDGTIQGTQIIKDIALDDSSIRNDYNYRPFFTVIGNNVIFRANDGKNGFEIFKTDGTEANTGMIKDIAPGNASSIDDYSLFMSCNNIGYFAANDQINGIELWRTDGTETGTFLLKDINPGLGNGIFQSNIYYDSDFYLSEKCYAILNNTLYFTAFDGNEPSIWKTDGTTNGTTKAITLAISGPNDYRPTLLNTANGKIFYKTNSNNSSYGNNTLWSSDGTTAGSKLLFTSIMEYPEPFHKTIVHNNKLYFSAFLEDRGQTLMKSDGTVEGTKILTTANFLNYRAMNTLKSCGKYVYFAVGENGVNYGKELWRTDGTAEGTILIEKIALETPENFINCTCVKDHLFYFKSFSSKNIWYVNDQSSIPASLEINVTNAKKFGEYEGINEIINYNDNLLFKGYTAESGIELYYANIEKTLGLNDLDDNQPHKNSNHITVYPNPASSNEKISFLSNDNAVIKNITIYSILGTKIQSISPDTETPLSLNLNFLPKGLYLVKIKTANYTETKKLIINK